MAEVARGRVVIRDRERLAGLVLGVWFLIFLLLICDSWGWI